MPAPRPLYPPITDVDVIRSRTAREPMPRCVSRTHPAELERPVDGARPPIHLSHRGCYSGLFGFVLHPILNRLFAADLRLQLHQIGKGICLAAKIVCDHRRLTCYGGYDGNVDAAALHRLDKRTKVAVSGK